MHAPPARGGGGGAERGLGARARGRATERDRGTARSSSPFPCAPWSALAPAESAYAPPSGCYGPRRCVRPHRALVCRRDDAGSRAVRAAAHTHTRSTCSSCTAALEAESASPFMLSRACCFGRRNRPCQRAASVARAHCRRARAGGAHLQPRRAERRDTRPAQPRARGGGCGMVRQNGVRNKGRGRGRRGRQREQRPGRGEPARSHKPQFLVRAALRLLGKYFLPEDRTSEPTTSLRFLGQNVKKSLNFRDLLRYIRQ